MFHACLAVLAAETLGAADEQRAEAWPNENGRGSGNGNGHGTSKKSLLNSEIETALETELLEQQGKREEKLSEGANARVV